MTTFTASEVVAKLRERFASGNDVPVPDVRLTRAEFDVIADRLEVDEKAQPVAAISVHPTPDGHTIPGVSMHQKLPVGYYDVFLHPASADAEKLAETLRECLADYSHPSFTDRHGMADRIRQALALHSAQAQPPAASVADAVFPNHRACVPYENHPGKRIVGFVIDESHPWWGKCGLTEPLSALEAALAAQENPNG